MRYLSVEFLVHAWDITRALGIDLDASAQLCGAVLANAQATRSTPFFGADPTGAAHFDPPVDPDPAASALDELIAYTGRQMASSTSSLVGLGDVSQHASEPFGLTEHRPMPGVQVDIVHPFHLGQLRDVTGR